MLFSVTPPKNSKHSIKESRQAYIMQSQLMVESVIEHFVALLTEISAMADNNCQSVNFVVQYYKQLLTDNSDF